MKEELSDLPSEILTQALDDLLEVDAKEEYGIDMGLWVEQKSEVCYVCAAGAVMVNRLRIGGNVLMKPSSFEPKTSAKLFFINAVREGDVEQGLSHLIQAEVGDVEKLISLRGRDWSEDYDGKMAKLWMPWRVQNYEDKELYINYIQYMIGYFQEQGL